MLKKVKYRDVAIVVLLVIYEALFYALAKFSPMPVHNLGTNDILKIPFVPMFIYIYISWYLLLYLVPLMLSIVDREVFFRYVKSFILIIPIAFLIFVLFPTEIARPSICSDSFTGWVVNLIYAIDTPARNCCPSMHAAISFFFIFSFIKCKNINKYFKALGIVWFLLIVLSTLFVYQHVLLDVVVALILCVIVYTITGLKVFSKLAK